MSQEDTYRPAVLPSEAVMMPAMEESMEEAAEAPLPVAQDDLPPGDPSMMTAQRSNMSHELEKLRNRGRVSRDMEWFNVAAAPLDRAANRPVNQPPAAARPEANANRPATLGQGAALTTLMRSAARQYRPAPPLMTPRMPQPPQPPMNAQQPTPMPQPQMRGALRQVVRNVQQPQGGMPMRPMPPPGE